ncbi:hypothetical protein OAC75_01425 [Pseudomonadales bacterium]|nr:hypothetical protein [Pseudomonadales bacterium]
MKMKAKGYSAGGAPKSRAQRRATLSRAQRSMLDGVQGREGSKQSTSVIQDLSDQYGYKPGKRAGAKGGMGKGKGKRAKPPGMKMGGVAMAPPGKKVPAMIKRPAASAPGTRTPSGKELIDTTKLGALPQSRSTRPTKATAMRGAAARRSGGSTPRGMNMGGAAMKTKGYAKGGAAMKTKGAAKGGVRKPSSSKSGLYGRR